MENGTTTECLLDETGRIFRRTVRNEEIALNEDLVFAALKDGQKTRIQDALFVNKELVSLCITTDKSTFVKTDATIPMPIIRLNTIFRLVGGIMVPVFAVPESSKEPRINIDWNVSEATSGKLRVWFLVKTRRSPENPYHQILKCYLVGTSGSNRMYKIPLANVYAGTGEICMGNDWVNKEHPTLQQALDAAWQQFMNSPYNHDLAAPNDKSDAMFRFKPDNEGFKTLPCVGQWNNLCERISNMVLETISLPPASGGDE